MTTFTTHSETETEKLGEAFAAALQPGDIISLTGDLGAGKTRFIQGVARGLGVEGPVTSPTFTIIREYDGRLRLYHFDVYRLTKPEELEPLGYEEYFFGDGVTLIEWGDKIKGLLPEDHLTIEIHHVVESATDRLFIVRAGGPRSTELLQALERL